MLTIIKIAVGFGTLMGVIQGVEYLNTKIKEMRESREPSKGYDEDELV